MQGRGPMRAMPHGRGAKDFKGTLKKLIKYMSDFKLMLLAVVIFSVASTVFTIIGPAILGTITTRIYEGVMLMAQGAGGIDFEAIIKTALLLIGIYLLSALFSYLQGFFMSSVSMKVTYNLRRDISDKISRLPLSYFDGKNFGEVLSLITNDVDAITNSLNQSLTQIISSIVTLVGVFIMMLLISPVMAIVTLCIIPLSALVMMLIVKRSQKYFTDQQRYLGHVNGHIEEMYSSHVVVKAFGAEKKSADSFDRLNGELYTSAWKSQFLSGLMHPIMMFIGNLGYVAATIMGGYFAITGRITVGSIQAFIQYVKNFTQPLSQIANISNVIQQTIAAAERVFEFLEETEEAPDDAEPADASKTQGNVSFDHVRFGYSKDKIIIKDFTSNIKKGQKVAIVGPTGAGKTTVVNLLMRFYELNGGAILIDGENITRFKKKDLRAQFAMVTQEPWLYSASVRENIRYGRLTATDEEVENAAKAASAHHFIMTLPQGYDTELNEESSNVSQGQKQLLTIARAVLADPKILILDEATSSVDTRTEALIQKAMDNLMKGRTSFIIAHRLSTIRDADMILVMNEGDIIEQGTHKELLEKKGFYYELYNAQFAGEDLKTTK
ncbi:MAG: ABC transporter ATP-binding protein [Clostridia bacterium]|nr:ABC transporter ATP-binding protein [Clostridia bacterium]